MTQVRFIVDRNACRCCRIHTYGVEAATTVMQVKPAWWKPAHGRGCVVCA